MKKKTSDAVTEELRIKNSLLKITGGLAKIRNRTELLRYIFHEIKKVFPFDTAGLFVMDEAADTFEEILEKGTLDDLQDEVATKQLLGPWSYAGHDARAWIYVEEPTLYNIEEQSKIYPNPQSKYMKQAGLQQMIAGALYHQGKKIGLLCFSSTSADCFLANNFPLFQAIANQLAVTVNNVLANEQLMEEQHFKETLLCISEAVATIQNRSQLFRVIFDRVQPILPFDAPGLFIIDGDQHYEILDEASASDVCNELVREGVGAIPFDNKTSFVQELIESEKTYIRPTSEIEHPQIEIMLTAGLRQIMYAPLKNAGKVIGVFILNSKQANQYRETDIPLFQAIADQFAIAVSNVLANERLVEEKKFSNTLLKITEAVASVNNTKELYKTIFTTIKPVLPFDEVGLFALDATEKMHYELIDESVLDRTDVQQLVEEKLGKHTRYKHRGSSVEWLMENGPIALSMTQLDENAPHPQHQYMITGGLKSILGGPLIYGGKAFGMLCFTAKKEDFYTEKDYPLFKSIAEQISIAVANIRANEEIRIYNLEKDVQIALMQGLNKETDWEARQKKLARALEQLFPADFVGFYYAAKGMDLISMGFEKIGFNEYRRVSLQDYLRIIRIDMDVFHQTLVEEEPQFPFILDLKGMAEAKEYLNPVRKASHDIFKFNAALCLHITIKDAPFYIYINSKQQNIYNCGHIEMFQRIAPSFAQSLEKSLDYEELLSLNQLLQQEKEYLVEEVEQQYNFSEMIGKSEAMLRVFEKIGVVLNTDTTVLILGETGTGKELVARSLHNQSARRNENFVKVNCAALPKELVESELFGHEKGAFTGAVQQRIGKFELANKGTIFLDEIGELPLDLQAKLLRVIQEKEFERLGGNKTIRTDVRILAATNRDLEKEIADGNFRTDLYFRLSVFPIQLPPLRDRGEDTLQLADYFLHRYNRKANKKIKKMGATARRQLTNYHWPGNIRELEHVIERSVLLTQGDQLQLALTTTPSTSATQTEFQFKTLQEAETELIYETLKRCGGKVSGPNGAAAMLGIPSSTLQYRMKRAGITKEMVVNR